MSVFVVMGNDYLDAVFSDPAASDASRPKGSLKRGNHDRS